MNAAMIDPWGTPPTTRIDYERRRDPVVPGGDLADVAPGECLEVWRRAVTLSDLEPVTRLVLLVAGVSLDYQRRRPGRPRADEKRLLRGSWPSVEWIAEHVARSEATVYRALAEAEDGDWIARVAICEEDGSRTGTLYTPGIPKGRLERDDEGIPTG